MMGDANRGTGGLALADSAPQAVRRPNRRCERPAERRQLTILFCDLVGSTALSARLDPEDMSRVMRAYYECCLDQVVGAGGVLAQFQGDGALAYFGYERAREDDPARAVRAALALVEFVPRLGIGQEIVLEARIGVATGLVVVGEIAGRGALGEQRAIGRTPNLAARLQALAGPGEVVISHSTRRLTAGAFRYQDLGSHLLKGLPDPVQVWQVLGPSAAGGRFEAQRLPVLTSMVGRDSELATLAGAWHAAAAGSGRMVGITGDAGIGKSRLLREFRVSIADLDHLWLQGEAAQSAEKTPFHAVAQMIRRRLDPSGQRTPARLVRRLEATLRRAAMDDCAALPILAELLDLPLPAGSAPAVIAPAERRARLFSVLRAWLARIARLRPVVLVIEDLHWADASTLELAALFAKPSGNGSFLAIYTARPSFRAPWPGLARGGTLPIRRLGQDSIRRIVTEIVGETDIASELLNKVVRRADGVPLFAEELARLVIEREGQVEEREIPDSLADLLMARLDRLGSAKYVAQVAAVLGEELSVPLLEMISAVPAARLRTQLAKLVRADVLEASGIAANPRYRFSHALIQDAAYGSLLNSQRRELHRRVALTIGEQFTELMAAHPEVLARHWTGAGEYQSAVAAWQEAGGVAYVRRAFTEAEEAYRQAVALLPRLPPTAERDALELSLQSALVGVLQITCGHSALSTTAAAARARSLAEAGGSLDQRLAHSITAWAAASSSGEYLAARRMADEILVLARAEGSLGNLAHAHMIQMTSRYRLGDFLGAEDHFERGLPLFQAPEFVGRAGAIAQTYGNAARGIWILGDADAARRRMAEGLSAAGRTNSPYDIAFALYMAAILALLIGETDRAESLAQQSMRLSEQHRFAQFASISRIVLGRAVAESGRARHGIDLILRGLAGMAETASRVARPLYLTWLAEAHAFAGEAGAALAAVEDALSTNPQELFFRPESLRIRGELHAGCGHVAQAAQDFRAALDLSEKMAAATFRERAAQSLDGLARKHVV